MEEFNDTEAIRSLDMNSVLTNTFFRMFLGLLASAITAFYAYSSGLWMNLFQNGTYLVFAVIELVVVIVFSLAFRKLSPTMVTILYFAYAFLNGFTLSIIFVAYQMTSIVYAFVGSAALFGALAFIGSKTKKDVSNWGTILLTALLIGLVLSIINLFIGNSVLDIVLDWAILFIFFGLTIYDVKKIQIMHDEGICEDEKLYVYGAMELYLDFINIFLRILSLFGKSKD